MFADIGAMRSTARARVRATKVSGRQILGVMQMNSDEPIGIDGTALMRALGGTWQLADARTAQ